MRSTLVVAALAVGCAAIVGIFALLAWDGEQKAQPVTCGLRLAPLTSAANAPIAPTHIESDHERALREKDAAIAEIQRLLEELRIAMALHPWAPDDDPLSPPPNVGQPVVPACPAATCPKIAHIRGRHFELSERKWDELNALFDENAGRMAAEIAEHVARREAAERARDAAEGGAR